MKKVYVYGTLLHRAVNPDVYLVSGQLYDLGWFPGAKIGDGDPNGPHFVAKVIEVSDAELDLLDDYEGVNPEHPEMGLYTRKTYRDGWIYEYNGDVSHKKLIPTGDWLEYKQEKVSC